MNWATVNGSAKEQQEKHREKEAETRRVGAGVVAAAGQSHR